MFIINTNMHICLYIIKRNLIVSIAMRYHTQYVMCSRNLFVKSICYLIKACYGVISALLICVRIGLELIYVNFLRFICSVNAITSSMHWLNDDCNWLFGDYRVGKVG